MFCFCVVRCLQNHGTVKRQASKKTTRRVERIGHWKRYRCADPTNASTKPSRHASRNLLKLSTTMKTSPENLTRWILLFVHTMLATISSEWLQMNNFISAFYDAVLLYAIALNETLENNENPRNGKVITQRMWNRTFEGITGNVSIDENGDRYSDYSLLDLDPKKGEFKVRSLLIVHQSHY